MWIVVQVLVHDSSIGDSDDSLHKTAHYPKVHKFVTLSAKKSQIPFGYKLFPEASQLSMSLVS